LTGWDRVQPANEQVALLVDDGLRLSVGRELDNLRRFVGSLPLDIEVMVGYLQHGSVVAAVEFTTDHAKAAAALRMPTGMPGESASPYLCLSDFVKMWPSSTEKSADTGLGAEPSDHKARFVLMLTNGVDPYNGSTSIANQDSPYVESAVADAQRAGVAVYSIYFGDAGIGGEQANFSGQGYLSQLTQATGGVNYYEGARNPVSMAPYLAMFNRAISETYVATFNAPIGNNPQKDLVRVKFAAPNTKLHAPEKVRPGNRE